MAKKVNDVKTKRSEVLYYRMLVVLAALISVVFSITYLTSTVEGYNNFTFKVAPILTIVFAVLSIPAIVYFVMMRVRGTNEQCRTFSSSFTLLIALWLTSIFGLYYILNTKKLFAYIVVTAALYFVYYLFRREFFVFSLYSAFGAAFLILINSAPATLHIVYAVLAVFVSVLTVALVLSDKKKAVTLKLGATKFTLTDGSFKAYPFCISAGILLAGVILSFFIVGAAFYSLVVLFTYYLIFTIVNTVKMM